MMEIIVTNTIQQARMFAIDMGWHLCSTGARKPDGTVVRFATLSDHLRGVSDVGVWIAGYLESDELRDYLNAYVQAGRLNILNKGSENDGF